MSDSQRYLELKVVSAREVHTAAKSPVYCELHFRDQTFRTKAVKGVEIARWDQIFFFGHFDSSDSIQISCLTKSKGSESNFGQVLLPLSEFDHEGVFEKEVTLEQTTTLEDSSGGVIVVEIHVAQEASALQSTKRSNKSNAAGGSGGGGLFYRIRMLFKKPKKLTDRHSGGPHEINNNRSDSSQKITKTYSSPVVNLLASETPTPATNGAPISASTPSVVKPSPMNTKVVSAPPPDRAEPAPASQLFGVPLAELLDRQRASHADLRVPLFVFDAGNFIRRKGINTMGVFRIRGKLSDIKELKELLDRGETINYEQIESIHTVTTLLKQFLRELPEPVLTFELCDAFLECTKLAGDEQIERLKENLSKLPRANWDLVKFIMELARDISTRADENKMTAENLATVISPNLLWRETVDITNLAMVDEAKRIGTLTHLIIVNFDVIFGVDSATSTSSTSSSPRFSSAADGASLLANDDL